MTATTTVQSYEQAIEDYSNAPGWEYLRKESYSCGGQSHEVALFKHEQTGLTFILIPGGGYLMGSPDDCSEASEDEKPQHYVEVEPYLLCQTPLTQEAWTKIQGENPSSNKGDQLPVESVSWHDAREFCEKSGLSLPTEEEWEYACRAGTTTLYSFGDDAGDLGDYAWFEDNTKSTQDVAQKLPNAFGLYDMHGNVWEWTASIYKPYPGPLEQLAACAGDESADPTQEE
jgi:formylglycine-generating enzyme required for sulfatase activity